MPQVKELKELKLPVGNEIGKTDMAGIVRHQDDPAIFVFPVIRVYSSRREASCR
jgi:hypothetical protein